MKPVSALSPDLYPELTRSRTHAAGGPGELPTLAAPDVARAGAVLADRRRAGTRGGLLPGGQRPRCHADALAVQAEVARALGWPVAGWKCGLPAPGKCVVAPVYAPTVYRGGPGSRETGADEVAEAVAWPWRTGAASGTDAAVVRVEPELAFVLQADLAWRAAPWMPAEVDAAVGATHLALELIDSRYEPGTEQSFDDKLADGLVNQGLFLGPPVDDAAARQALRFPITMQVPGCPDTVLGGVMPDGPPRGPLYWLAEFLRQHGTGLRAGQVVITGSYAGALDLPVDQVVSLQYGELGRLSVRLRARQAAIASA